MPDRPIFLYNKTTIFDLTADLRIITRLTDPRPFMDINAYMQNLGEAARNASRAVARASTNAKNAALQAVYRSLSDSRDSQGSGEAQ